MEQSQQVLLGTPEQRSMLGPEGLIARTVAERADDLREVRRHLHRHPELSHEEHDTTEFVLERLRDLGLAPQRMASTGAICDIPGSDPTLAPIALRADMDALGIPELTTVSYRSTVEGVSHACGHDVHMSAVLGAATTLVRVADAGALRRGVRLVFQPSEEMHPCGALDLIGQGVLDGVDSILALHCDPGVDVGHVGLKSGPITSATDPVKIQVRGAGGHTSRPHLTQDLVYALGSIVTQLPAALTRRMDPRSGVNLTWGSVHAGSAFNAIPSSGTLEGTLRCLDHDAWDKAEELLESVLADLVRPWGIEARVTHDRGVPPVSNAASSVDVLSAAVTSTLGREFLDPTAQSLGGEDFAWYLEKVPGALARLGTRTPGGRTYDLHMGDLMIDERAIGIGASVLASACVQRDLLPV
ncbi:MULTISPECIES: M20 family metallopeptidase [Brachybacterium]|uniref:M20 family metallopeptidase n=1 Tax=Brachybacterium TaxID=43668 RepID=UPI000BB9A6B5|nr:MULTISPECIES: M20 family metallopeptidase [Brachybacterium]PCC35633.1 N-acyl-L-amino acid amidohydrolase [Brachybacterium alimentarium]RCS64701.1 amidohydrolase [Brachybacterium sp. JB7]RCS66584.1 amidohydrolase [Brachybacterium alimentarium]RCS67985.1 amidohydrolase [Brachybacterium alimentarium]RCS80992.1 amidohydrolase [Brachybacterium alimentarium]